MKKPIFVFCTFLSSIFCLNAQITNTFPDSGNVGIGTTTPTSKIHLFDTSSTALRVESSNMAIELQTSVWGADLQLGRFQTDRFAGVIYANSKTFGISKQWFAGIRSGNSDYHIFSETGLFTAFKINQTSGNVSIGNTNNIYKLDVTGTGRFTGLLNIQGGAEISENKTMHFSAYNEDYYIAGNSNGYKLEIGYGNVVGSNQIMVFDGNKNVGIGTTSPGEKLHVNGLIRIPSATNEDNNSPGIVAQSNDDFLYDGQYLNHYGFGFHGYQDGSGTYVEPMNTYMSGYFGVDFFTSGQNRMRISNDGIVSIGTVNRQIGYKLAVNGNIKAKEIKVETGWSDFVFESNYNLPTLKEVEQHIKEKGHLKDIPSAKEVAENGILLGGMNAKLLQKIEELTLYTIEQEKQLEKQEILIKQQDEVNQELKDRLLKIELLLSKN